MLLASRDSGERLAAQRALEHLGPAAADALEPLIKSDEILEADPAYLSVYTSYP